MFSNVSYVTLQEDSEVLSHLLEALEFGAPPHGGIALGECFAIIQNAGVLWLSFGILDFENKPRLLAKALSSPDVRDGCFGGAKK